MKMWQFCSRQDTESVCRPVRGRFPSGQRGQTVNLLAKPSKVRILLSPGAFFPREEGFLFPVMPPTGGGEYRGPELFYARSAIRMHALLALLPPHRGVRLPLRCRPRTLRWRWGRQAGRSADLLPPGPPGLARRVSLREKANLDCMFWENGGCSVYEARPLQCRSFPFWSALVSSEEWDLHAQQCPGIGKGSLHSRVGDRAVAGAAPEGRLS